MKNTETVTKSLPITMYHSKYVSGPVIAIDPLEEKYLRGSGWISADEFFAETVKAQNEAEAARLQAEAEAAAAEAERTQKAAAETAKILKQREEDEAIIKAGEDAVIRRQNLLGDAYRAQKQPIEQRLSYLRERELALVEDALAATRNGASNPELHRKVLEIHGEMDTLIEQMAALERKFEAEYNGHAV